MPELFTLQDFADHLAELLGTPKTKTYDASRRLFEVLAAHVSRGGRATLHSFGSFSLVSRRARKGRNPKTGEIIPIPARKVIVFKAAKGLRESVARKKRK